ncbi:hypothetical protein [Rheinheimera gaetbuli]
MKQILDAIDGAIKRLVSPTAMIVAAALLAQGSKGDGATPFIIKVLIWILSIFALGYLILSYLVAFKEIEASGYSKLKTGFISLAFMLVYFVLVLAGIRFGIDKIG